MSRPHLKRVAFLAFVAVFALAGCGGGGGDSSSPSTTSTAASSGSGSDTNSQSTTSSGSKQNKPAPTGDQSVQQFGQAASGSDSTELTAAFKGYLGAMGDSDYAKACSYLSEQTIKSLLQIVTPQYKAKGCEAIVPKILSSSAAAIARQQANGTITRIRVKGDQAFVTYHAPGAVLYVLPMVKENGAWKATSLAGSILIPSPASIGAAP